MTRTSQATVIEKAADNSYVRVRVRRACRTEQLDTYFDRKAIADADLQVGDVVNVYRQVNNPYLRFAGRII